MNYNIKSLVLKHINLWYQNQKGLNEMFYSLLSYFLLVYHLLRKANGENFPALQDLKAGEGSRVLPVE